MEKWQDPSLPLGIRCVAFAENEMKNGVKEDKLNSFTSPRIREYLAICKRRGTEKLLGLTSGNWCAAGVSFCLKNASIEGDEQPHGYRAGAIEIEDDLKAKNLWRPVALARSKTFLPEKGDVVIFNRSNPKDPNSFWFRHIGFYYDGDDKGNFRLLSGNNGGCWKIDKHTFNSAKLLGFGEYPGVSARPNHIIDDKPTDITHHIDDERLIPGTDTGTRSTWSQVLDIFSGVFK
jgi:hypothetical protein